MSGVLISSGMLQTEMIYIVSYLQMDPLTHMFTLCPLVVIHMVGEYSPAFFVFCHFSLAV